MSSIGSGDLSDRDDFPTVADQIDHLQHFTLDLLRKLRSLEDKLVLAYEDIYELELHHIEQRKTNSTFAFFIIGILFLIFTIILTLLVNTLK